MKSLLLLRHAKSSWDDSSLDDFDRPLAPRGQGAAPRMATYLRENGLVPDLVLCSAARRTQETWERMAPVIGNGVRVRMMPALYHTRPDAMLALVQSQPDDLASLMLIGHNPGIESLALELAGDGSEKGLERMRKKFPTAAVAALTFDVERWAEVERGSGFLDRFVRPKDLD